MNKTSITGLGILLVFTLLAPMANARENTRRKTPMPSGKSGFPAYQRAPSTNPKVGGINHVPARTDYLGNRVTADHLNRVEGG